jgi:AraC family transcriptional regulator
MDYLTAQYLPKFIRDLFNLTDEQINAALTYIQANRPEVEDENLSLSALANELGMSQYYFCHLFKQSTGMSPHQYLISQRVERAKPLLRQSERNITFIAMECGFANSSHCAKCFRTCTGMNPNQFGKL